MHQPFTSGSQSIGASASFLPVNIQGWFPSGLTGLVSLLSKGLSESFPASQFESINSVVLSLPYGLQEVVKDREAWCAAVLGVTESDTTERLNSNKQPPEWLFIKDLNLWGLEPGA